MSLYNVATIQVIMRHKSPKTTEIYLKSLGLDDVREALENLSQKNSRAAVLKPKQFRGAEKSSFKKKKPSGEPSTPQTARTKLRVVK